MVRGTRVGGRQMWSYRGRWKERKYKPRNWRFTFNATKHQHRRGRFPKGGRIHWRIVADQYVVKTGDNRYQTHMVGHKRLVSKRIPRRW